LDKTNAKRSPHLQQILDNARPRHEPEVEEAALKDARPAIPTPMLDLVMSDGQVESFSYAYLSRVRFDPRGRLALYFGDDVAVLEGRNMAEIRQKIRMHKASEVYEGIEAEEALKPENAAHVERIYLTSAKQEEERYDAGHDTGIK
jgi:hypothetical protein